MFPCWCRLPAPVWHLIIKNKTTQRDHNKNKKGCRGVEHGVEGGGGMMVLGNEERGTEPYFVNPKSRQKSTNQQILFLYFTAHLQLQIDANSLGSSSQHAPLHLTHPTNHFLLARLQPFPHQQIYLSTMLGGPWTSYNLKGYEATSYKAPVL